MSAAVGRHRARVKHTRRRWHNRRVAKRWRYRLAPDPRSRPPKGLPGLWMRLRRMLWSWWPWAALFLVAMVLDRWYWAAGLGLMAVFCYMIAPKESPPRYGLDHAFSVADEEFLPTMAGATGAPFVAGSRIEILNNGDEFYPAMLDAIEHAEVSITIEAYIYWAGHIGKRFAAGPGGPRPRRRDRENSARCCRLHEHRRRHPAGARGRRLPGGVVQPDSLVHARPLQPPHPPQVAHHRRRAGLHRRRGHRRSVGRPRAGSRALARHPDSRRRPGGDAAANGVRGQLAAHDRRADLGSAVLPADRSHRPAGGADDRQLTGSRRLDGPRDVLPVDRVRAKVDLHRQPVLRAR